jgi:hypothetical protein
LQRRVGGAQQERILENGALEGLPEETALERFEVDRDVG